MDETTYILPCGPAASPMHQALHQLALRCAEINTLHPDEAAALTRRINQFHVELIETPIERLQKERR